MDSRNKDSMSYRKRSMIEVGQTGKLYLFVSQGSAWESQKPNSWRLRPSKVSFCEKGVCSNTAYAIEKHVEHLEASIQYTVAV